ncbi:MAG: 4-hydroxy-3-methylbut-2-enyl diphosphate reductase [Candidatus Krumholzibacteria bacterium]|nr:4-hydroxy-3-methylbut-2-enyl diphosphate reductase [Candidatus Krumholzibacteria bacterium]MDH4336001.1 4-hydroxy-3-methylbut-2-enyl diphosphate reductase [Candidatus Krumholzibacteria bacterium]MDH5268423.1 4-hydroxy-3-methylbut-2-enyl diphosphate reductase [Candidatus Krumholzibacteria bacterium]
MARRFETPDAYHGGIITRVKHARQDVDPRKHDLAPAVLDFGPVRVVLARHFGFCYGVENAVEIAYRTLAEHRDRRVFFLSEMIHNPTVNGDLRERGVRFLFTPSGEQLVPWEELTPDDIVVVPAFGTTLEMQEKLSALGIDPYRYNTTCPFVEKVWKRSAQLGGERFAVVVHGKDTHEETRATFSHSRRAAPTVVVRDHAESVLLGDVIRGTRSRADFDRCFGHKCTPGFDPETDLVRLGVVNQTTMLATETHEIARELRRALAERYGEDAIADHFADTSDTLCYATYENQNATYALIEHGADLALVVGGYNSSNTSHIVELCQKAMPTYFVQGEAELVSSTRMRHFSLESRSERVTDGWMPDRRPLDVVLTCGASCPDAILDAVLRRLLSFFEDVRDIETVLAPYPALVPETGR